MSQEHIAFFMLVRYIDFKRQEARGKRQEAKGKRQEARGKRQEAKGKS
jgi:hypothetical protein